MTNPYNVLFLCTGNSARRVLGESLVNHWGRGRFVGYRAGSHPKGEVLRLELLDRMGLQKQLDAIGTVTEEDVERLPVRPGAH